MPLSSELSNLPNVEILEAQGDIRGLIKVLRYQKDADIRRAAILALGRIGDRQTVTMLITALNDPQWAIRRDIASVLGQMGDEQAIEPLIQAAFEAHNSGNIWQVTEAAFKAIGKIGGDQAFEFLLSVFNNYNYPHNLRIFASKGLGESRDPRAVESLVSILNDETAIIIHKDAAEALGKIGDKRAIGPLINALQDTKGWGLSVGAAKALGEIGDKQVIKPLVMAFLEKDRPTCEAAAEALAKIENEQAFEALVSALDNKRDWVRTEAVKALGLSGNKRAVEPIIAILDNSDGWMRLYGVRALGMIGDERAVPALIERLSDTWVDPEAWSFGEGRVCDVAAAVLERIGTPEALEAFQIWLKENEEEVDRTFLKELIFWQS